MMKRERMYWVSQLIGWLSYGSIIILLMSVVPTNDSVPRFQFIYLVTWGGTIGIGFFLSHIYRVLINRWRWGSLPIGSLITRIIIACFTLAIIWEVLALIFLIPFKVIPVSIARPGELIIGALPFVIYWCLIYLVWSLLYFGFHYAENFRKVEIEKWKLESIVKETELNVLRSQMNPHFIFNCLNSVRAMILEDPDRAQTMVTQLANLLRYSLRLRNTPTVTLSEELEIVSDYLELEKIRLEDRLRIALSIDSRTLNAPIPTMLLQTLVENGIKHGISEQMGGGEIRVTSQLQDGILHLQVINTGRSDFVTDSTGIGLKNSRERLKLLFGDTAALEIKNDAKDMVTVFITYPFKASAF